MTTGSHHGFGFAPQLFIQFIYQLWRGEQKLATVLFRFKDLSFAKTPSAF
jgi:hypothetical protein